jgi:hypothetical protein
MVGVAVIVRPFVEGSSETVLQPGAGRIGATPLNFSPDYPENSVARRRTVQQSAR